MASLWTCGTELVPHEDPTFLNDQTETPFSPQQCCAQWSPTKQQGLEISGSLATTQCPIRDWTVLKKNCSK